MHVSGVVKLINPKKYPRGSVPPEQSPCSNSVQVSTCMHLPPCSTISVIREVEQVPQWYRTVDRGRHQVNPGYEQAEVCVPPLI